MGNPNQPQLSYSDFGLRHCTISAAGRHFAYANNTFATTLGLVFEAAQGNRSSYVGDLNRDNISGNDLIFVPASQSQIIPVSYTNGAGQTVTAPQ